MTSSSTSASSRIQDPSTLRASSPSFNIPPFHKADVVSHSRFCLHIHTLLEVRPGRAHAHPYSADSRAQDPAYKAKRIILYSSDEADKKANAALLLALYAVSEGEGVRVGEMGGEGGWEGWAGTGVCWECARCRATQEEGLRPE